MRILFQPLFALLLSVQGSLFAQATLTLDECLKWAQDHHPASAIQQLHEESNTMQIKQLSSGYFPATTLGAQAVWQSEVFQLPFEVPGFEVPTPTQDQYRATLDVQQLVWDGGVIAHQKNVANAQFHLNQQTTAIQLYQQKERTLQAFFAVLFAKEQIALNSLFRENLRAKRNQAEAALNNGVIIEAELLQVDLRLLELEQQRTELETDLSVAIEALKTLTGRAIPPEIELVVPVSDSTAIGGFTQRPEWQQFSAQQAVFDVQTSLVKAKNLPKLSLFATLGYGRPGLNILSNEFEPYAIAGARLQWNLTPFYAGQQSRDIELLQVQTMITEQQKAAWTEQWTLLLQQHVAAIRKLENSVELGGQRLSLSKTIRQSAEIQLEQGIITYPDLLEKMTAEQSLEQSLALFRLQLHYAKIKLKWVNGQL